MGREGVEGAQPRVRVCRFDDQKIPLAGADTGAVLSALKPCLDQLDGQKEQQ